MNLVKQINFIKMDYFVSRCVSTTMLSMTIKLIKSKFDLTPQGIIEYLKLKEPIFSKTTNYGHFGREEFSWEELRQI